MRKLFVAALVCALALTGAVTAWAVTSAETNISANFSPNNKRKGTSARPAAKALVINHDQSTTTGSGQPETTRAIRLIMARGWHLRSGIWPRRARCNIRTVNQRGSDSSCPRGSRVGSGVVNLLAGDGGIREAADLRVHVSTDGDLFIFLDSRPGEPVELNAAVPCEVTRGRTAQCNIPETLQRPAGVKSSIDNLRLRIAGARRVRGKLRSILETTGCRRAWVFTFEAIFVDGVRKRETDRVRC
jgi:hypothetical protein